MPKLRLLFRTEHNSHQTPVGLCQADFKSIQKMAQSKLKLSKQTMGRSKLLVEATGEELWPDDPNLSKLVRNGSVIVVCTSTAAVREKNDGNKDRAQGSLVDPLPPAPHRYCSIQPTGQSTLLDVDHGDERNTEETHSEVLATLPSIPAASVSKDKAMTALQFHGEFPILEGNVLPILRDCIAGCSGFTETDCGTFSAFDYSNLDNVPKAFPNPKQCSKKNEKWKLALRRECRGLLVDRSTGRVLRRPFHKFFNVNEVPETSSSLLDDIICEDDMVTLQKMDGSLVSPVFVGGEMHWATRKTLQPSLKAFCSTNPSTADYNGLAQACILESNQTPLFEWCEADKAVGVVQHSQSSLTLLAIRDMTTGGYVGRQQVQDLAQQFRVPCVEAWSSSTTQQPLTISSLVQQVAAEPAPLEGIVVIYNGGKNFLKMKTQWYVSMAAASKQASSSKNPWTFLLEFLQRRNSLKGVPRQHLWKAGFCTSNSQVDDSKSLCLGLLPVEERQELNRFLDLCFTAHQHLHSQLQDWSSCLRHQTANYQGDGKYDLETVITKTAKESGWSRRLLRAYVLSKVDGENNHAANLLRQELAQQAEEGLRMALGFYWDQEEAVCIVQHTTKLHTSTELPRSSTNNMARYILRSDLFPAEALDRPPKGLSEHVCSQYLVRKVANYLGKPKTAILGETMVEIPSDYVGSEGKLKGMWERFAKKKIVDLRIDLQPPLPEGNMTVTEHNGTTKWALLLVQYGPSSIAKNSSRVKEGLTSGRFAGVFIETNCVHLFSDIRKAMNISFEECRLVFLSSQVSIVPSLSRVDQERHLEVYPLEDTRPTVSLDTKDQPWTIYVDLDGVLADFDASLVARSGKRSGDFANANEMWRFIMSTKKQDFFANLPWTNTGQRLWNFVNSLVGCQINILTGVPAQKNGGKSAARQKQTWCKEKLGGHVEVITCRSSDKHKWSGPKCILIDDSVSHKKQWEASGGKFFHYTGNFNHTARQVRSFVLPNGGLSTEEQTAVSRIRERAARQEGNLELDETKVHYVRDSDGDRRFADSVKELSNDFIAIDCEWSPDELNARSSAHSCASLIQVAMRGMVYVVDTHHISPVTRRALLTIFCPQEQVEWKVIFFGMSEDLNRLVAAIPEIAAYENKKITLPLCVDLQQTCRIFGLGPSRKNINSLSDVAVAVLGCSTVKDKSVQASDWSHRPLSPLQIKYAAYDAFMHLAVWEAIADEECLCHAALHSIAEPLPIPSKNTLRRYRRIRQDQQNTVEDEPVHALANPAPILSCPPTTGGVKPSYTAIFLTKGSSERLLDVCPPLHRNVLADHVTLTFEPDTDSLAGLPVGTSCQVHVKETLSDNKSQVARVELLNDNVDMDIQLFMNSPQTAHITLSTTVNVPAARSGDLLMSFDTGRCEQPPETLAADLVLEGIIGLKVQLNASQTMLASINKSVLVKLMEFVDAKVPGSKLTFRAGSISSGERATIHEFCKEKGILSRSEGPKESRKLVLAFPKFIDDSEDQIDQAEGRIVQSANDLDERGSNLRKSKGMRKRDARNIAADYLCISREVFEQLEFEGSNGKASSLIKSLGELRFNPSTREPEIHLDPERQLLGGAESGISDAALLESLLLGYDLPAGVATPICVIMRGLPGSGKSSFARSLRDRSASKNSVAIVSADDFFQQNGSYDTNFNESQLGEAHDFCRNTYEQELINEGQMAVIVDNTNSRLAEYKFYTDRAAKAGKRYIVVEILCRSEKELQEFYHRGLHRVPIQAMGKMHSRWEKDDSALSFVSVSPTTTDAPAKREESLRAWLSQNHMFHNTKRRSKTFLNLAGVHNKSEAQFILLPSHLEVEFFRRYAQDDTDWYLAEYATLPLFPFFCDIDHTYVGPNSAIDHLVVASSLSRVLNRIWGGSRRSPVIIVGRPEEERDTEMGEFRQGFHLHCPNTHVTKDEALQLRALLMDELLEREGRQKQWEKIVDPTVYEHMTLRLLGSFKPGQHKRVYDLLGVLDADGHPNITLEKQYRQDRIKLLMDCSIRLRE